MEFQLVVLRGRSATTALKLGDGVTTAGRHDECQLRIKSSEVSRRHCQFFEKNGMLLVKDLGSANGTFLNGKKIEGQRVLEPGDELAIGPVKLRVEKLGQAAPAAQGSRPVPRGAEAGRHRRARPDGQAGRRVGRVRDRLRRRARARLGRQDGGREARRQGQGRPGQAAPAPAKPPRRAAEPTPAEEPAMADDAIADFLLDLKLDDDE